MNKQVAIIVAVDEKYGIGKDGKIPWHYSEDMKHFSKITRNSTCIMGRITAQDILTSHNNESLLPTRESIVITSDPEFSARDSIVASSLEDAINKATREKIFIIGGAGLYNDSLKYITEAIITFVPGSHDCDTNISSVIDHILTHFMCVEETISQSGLVFNRFKINNK